jgi:hypothetical protein
MDFLDVCQKFNSVNTLSYLFTNVAVDTRVRVMVLNALSTYFSYIAAVSFYGGGNGRVRSHVPEGGER